MAKTKKKKKSKTKSKKAAPCCQYEENYKGTADEVIIRDLIRSGILQDLESMSPDQRSFESFVGEFDLIASRHDKMKVENEPSLADVRNYIIEYGVLPLGCPNIRDGYGATNALLLYGPKGSGKTMLSRAVATSCSARWFDLSPSHLCDSNGPPENKEHIMALVHMTFYVAKLLQPSVIYIDEFERLFEDGNTGAHPSFLLDALKTHMKKIKTADAKEKQKHKKSRLLVIGNTSQPFMIPPKSRKALKTLFTITTENKELRHMIYCPYPDYRNRALLWRKFMRESLHPFGIDLIEIETKGLDIHILSRCSEGYSAGSLKQAVRETMSHRRIQKYIQLGKQFVLDEFISNLSKTEYTYQEDYKNFQNFTTEITCRMEGIKAIEQAHAKTDEDVDPKKKPGKKGKKP